MALSVNDRFAHLDEATYKKRIRAWTMYDWANSAFATTILAAFLPVYYSSVAGSTLPSEATATAYWSITLSISLFIAAIFSPILGTVSDVMRGKKLFLSVFVAIGVIGTGLLVLVGTGDWLLASAFLIIGRIGFSGANVFYDALLPHVARPDDQDRVSALGYALGYLGGGLLLAINVAMFLFIPDIFENAGVRLSFLSVAIWWAVFSIPILRHVPEPPSDVSHDGGAGVIGTSIQRIRQTFSEIRQYSELFKFLIAFLIYNDAIGTIIGLAAIYGAELGFGTLELVLALLLVQFVGIPFSLMFGRLPAQSGNGRRSFYLAFILFNLVALPLAGIVGANALPADVVGQRPAPYVRTGDFYGEGAYGIGDAEGFYQPEGDWQTVTVTGAEQTGRGLLASLAGTPDDVTYLRSATAGSAIDFALNGEAFVLTHDVGPDRGAWAVWVNDAPLTTTSTIDGEEVETPIVIDMKAEALRYNEETRVALPAPGQYSVRLISAEGEGGAITSLASIQVPAPARRNNLGLIIGALLSLQGLGLVFAMLTGRFFRGLADTLDTRRSILLALLVYGVISCWGFVLDATIEFWFLAWMVAIVQGGSQALSRSLYSALSPASKSGEFFGLYSIMEKAASILGPLLFALAVVVFGSSRPAILSLIAFFAIGGFLLTRVNIAEGIRRAQEEDAAVFGRAS